MRVLVSLFHGDSSLRARIRGESTPETPYTPPVAQVIVGSMAEAHRLTTLWMQQHRGGCSIQGLVDR